ncbi:DUF6164 family protein [Marinomonas sp. 15G1-11]|uniref:DUF6164 family protein n=1 Tax=Marinomonas phaeophyticola TaxID=3004091 RepID=A0ABT4JSI2_9GAMM|nr:DUF6164 family protein [Marinomonas sp. 15G1-11]MCZ2721314.1 DUF6164 family protein [Marinomonas sp. 15G1-11]
MAKLVFALKYVPDEEAAAVRKMLSEHHIEFYETTAGRWQISLAALWVRHDADFQKARALIYEDQLKRQASYREQKIAFWPAIMSHLKENPIEFAFTLFAIVFVAGLSVLPFYLTL